MRFFLGTHHPRHVGQTDEQMRETVRRARELVAFASPDPDQWSEHNREIAAALCNEELPALCDDNDALRAELARVEAERDALRAIVERARSVLAGVRHTDDCAAVHHEHCTPEECDYDDLAPEACLRAWREDCECGVKALADALGMEVSRG